ncbi:MAG: cation transporter [Elusimicrobiaceae bacterium]|nr:cation transporter [Elusimicrobiaceae bacterium]
MEETQNMRALAASREQIIVKTSIVGIATNILLAAFKAAVGLLSNSIAIILDAVNNLSDALSSVITIIGAKLAGKQPDKKHPLGHGRIEYLSSMFVSALVLYAGITALIESVKKMIHPEDAHYSLLTLIILVVAIIAKLVLGKYVKTKGKQVNSGALIASGSDASFDAILSASVLACALLRLWWGISLEAYVGAVISVVIMKAGIGMLQETLHDILGQRPAPELVKQIKEIIQAQPLVHGVYDLLINNYGPNKNYASLHVELDDTLTVAQVDELTRKIENEVFHKTGIILTGVGVYAYNTSSEEIARIRNTVQEIVLSHDWTLQMHGFYADTAKKTLQFDVVLSFDVEREEALNTLTQEVQAKVPGYTVQITPDVDLAD